MSPDEALETVRAGFCPYCGEGPFTVPAAHASKRHDIDKRTFRDHLGLLFSDPVCDPAYSKMIQQKNVERDSIKKVQASGNRSLTRRVAKSDHRGPAPAHLAAADARRTLAKALHAAGTPPDEIAATVGVTVGTVRRMVR